MPLYKWQQRATKYFGPVWFPVVELELQDAHGKLHGIAFHIDSGATVSLLRKSVAELLSIVLESGLRMELGSIGGGTVAYLHTIRTQIGQHGQDVRFAISQSEDVPNLLGRLDVFETCRVQFDPLLKQTSIEPAWCDTAGHSV